MSFLNQGRPQPRADVPAPAQHLLPIDGVVLPVDAALLPPEPEPTPEPKIPSAAAPQMTRAERRRAANAPQWTAAQPEATTPRDDGPSSLGDAFPLEQARCRELLGEYRLVQAKPTGPNPVDCSFAIASIEDVLRRADEAAISGDVVAMIGLYGEMRELQ